MKAWGTRWPLCSRPGSSCWWHRGHLAGCWLVCLYFSLSCLICNASIHLPIRPIRPSLIPPADLSDTSSTDVQHGGALQLRIVQLVCLSLTRTRFPFVIQCFDHLKDHMSLKVWDILRFVFLAADIRKSLVRSVNRQLSPNLHRNEHCSLLWLHYHVRNWGRRLALLKNSQ